MTLWCAEKICLACMCIRQRKRTAGGGSVLMQAPHHPHVLMGNFVAAQPSFGLFLPPSSSIPVEPDAYPNIIKAIVPTHTYRAQSRRRCQSLMDPVTAVGLLASIIQIAGLVKAVGTRVVSFTKQTSDALGYLKAFENHANTIMLASETIKEHIEQSSQEFERIKPLVSQLLPTVLSHCRSVHEILSKYMPGDGDSTFKSVSLAFRSFAKDHRLRDLVTSMNADATQLSMVLSCLGLKRNNKTEVSASWSHLHGRTIWTVPNRLVSHFVGQEDLLSRIAKALQPDEKAEPIQRIAVLQGMGGQGKTQLALRYCGLAKAATRYSGTFWIDSSNETSTRQSFEALADVLKSEEQSFQDADGRINYVKCLLAEWPEQWLMVFDNYDNPMDFKNLRDYMPTGNSGSVLVTSRSAHTRRFTSDDTQFLEVDGMAEEDAVNLLYKSSRVTRDDTNIEYAKDIARRLGYLPLAIDQAGAYLLASDNSITFQHFLSHYEANQREILESTPAVWDYLHAGTLPGQEETTKSVFTTWELSMRLLQEQPHIGPAKSQVLTLLAYFDEADISEELFSSYHNGVVHHGGIPDWLSIFHERGSWSSVRFGKVMSEMKALSLVYSTTPPTKSSDEFWHVSLHPLVRDWVLLRQCDETMAINSATSSAILAATFLGYWRTADDSNIFWDEVNDPNMECGWFSSTATLSLPFKAHARAWEERLAAAEITHLGLFERRDPCENVASEIVLLKFQSQFYSISLMYASICERLWRYCATHDEVLHWIKYQLGLFWIDCLEGRGLWEEAIDFCREFVELWRGRQSATAHKINYEACATLRLAESLLLLEKISSVSEAETLLEQLEKDHDLSNPKTSHLARAIPLTLSAILIECGHQECLAKATSLRAIFAGKGKDGWTMEDRRRRLSAMQWPQVLRLDDLDNQTQLQHEWVAMAQERYGEADWKTRHAWMSLASSLAYHGNTDESITIHLRLLSELRQTYPCANRQLSLCLLELGKILCGQDRHGEGQEYLLESIEIRSKTFPDQQKSTGLEALAALSLSYLECRQLDQARSLWNFMCKEGQGLLGFDGGLMQFAHRANTLSLDEGARPVAARIMDAGIYIFIEMTRHRQNRAQFKPEEDGSHIFEGYDVFVFDDAVLIWDEVGRWSGCELLLSRLILIAQLGSFAPYADLLDSALSEFARKKTTLVQSLARDFIRYVSALATWIRDDAALRGRYSTWTCETAREMYGEEDDLTKRCVEILEDIQAENKTETRRTKTPSWIAKLSLRHFRNRLRNGENKFNFVPSHR